MSWSKLDKFINSEKVEWNTKTKIWKMNNYIWLIAIVLSTWTNSLSHQDVANDHAKSKEIVDVLHEADFKVENNKENLMPYTNGIYVINGPDSTEQDTTKNKTEETESTEGKESTEEDDLMEAFMEWPDDSDNKKLKEERKAAEERWKELDKILEESEKSLKESEKSLKESENKLKNLVKKYYENWMITENESNNAISMFDWWLSDSEREMIDNLLSSALDNE